MGKGYSRLGEGFHLHKAHIQRIFSRLPKRGRKTTVVLGAIALALVVGASVVLAGASPPGAGFTGLAKGSQPAQVVSASSFASRTVGSRVIVGHSAVSRSIPLRDMRPQRMRPLAEHEVRNPFIPYTRTFRPDGARQTRQFPNSMPAPILNFEGIDFPGVSCNCAPPDTNGEVGLTQYVQIVNEGFEVFNKSNGAVVQAARSIESIWTGSGQNACTTGGFGDPVVLFDQLANRWVITEFASATGGTPITDECIAVSTGSDASAATSSTTRTSASGPTPTTCR